MAEALRTTYWVPQIGSKLARSACGTKRSVRAPARCDIAGVASPPAVVNVAAPAADFRKTLRSMTIVLLSVLSSSLADTPEERHRPLDDSAEILAPCLILQKEPGRRIDHLLACGLVEAADSGLLVL